MYFSFKGPNIRDGPEAFAKLMDKSRPKDEHQPPNQHPPSHRHHHQQQQKQHKSVVAPSGEEKQVKYPSKAIVQSIFIIIAAVGEGIV